MLFKTVILVDGHFTLARNLVKLLHGLAGSIQLCPWMKLPSGKRLQKTMDKTKPVTGKLTISTGPFSIGLLIGRPKIVIMGYT